MSNEDYKKPKHRVPKHTERSLERKEKRKGYIPNRGKGGDSVDKTMPPGINEKTLAEGYLRNYKKAKAKNNAKQMKEWESKLRSIGYSPDEE